MQFHGPTTVALIALFVSTGCTEERQPCQEYVSYMCSCHLNSEACQQLRTTYSGADEDLQDECAISLRQQRSADEDEPNACADTGDSG